MSKLLMLVCCLAVAMETSLGWLIRDRAIPRDALPTIPLKPPQNTSDVTEPCDVKLQGDVMYMKYQDIARVYGNTFLKSGQELGIQGCSSRYICPDKQQCSPTERKRVFYCSARSRGGCRSTGGTSDYGKCCETCQSQLDLSYHTFTHATYGITLYPVQFPSLDMYQPATIGFCGLKTCSHCEEKTGLHTFLVSTSPVRDPPTGPIPLMLHTEELPMYCRCITK